MTRPLCLCRGVFVLSALAVLACGSPRGDGADAGALDCALNPTQAGCQSPITADAGLDGSVCAPQCVGKACGDDGCGGTCGSCTDGTACDATGQCTAPCGSVTQVGCCSGSTLQYCDNAVLKSVTCTNQACGWMAAQGYYDCGTTGADPSGTYPRDCP